MGTEKLNQSDFARVMGVNKATVTKWVAARRIEVVDGMIDVEAAKARLVATENLHPQAQAQIARHAQDRNMRMNPDVDAQKKVSLDKLNAATKLKNYELLETKVRIANQDLARASGLLVDRADVDYVLADFGNTLRSLLESLADRLAPAIARHRGDVAAIHTEIEEAATDLLHEMYEKLKRQKENHAN